MSVAVLMPARRLALGLGTLALLTTLGGCAGLNTFSADVSTFGDWPAERKPSSYAFDRLPSQQANADEQQVLEAAAEAALKQAGFQPAAAGAQPDVLVQLAARSSRSNFSPWDDPLWWNGGFGPHGRYSLWRGRYWGPDARWSFYSTPRYEREVAVLLRDRASGKPLYEARASNEGLGTRAEPLLAPLFAAALAQFPATQAEPHRVVVPLGAGATP